MIPWREVQSVLCTSEEESLEFARAFAATLQPGDRVALEGTLGAGKTFICRGICRALGYTGSVHSPSYAIVHEYPNVPPIFHLDLYRLESAADVQELGLEEPLLQKSITLVEWPERMGDPHFFTHRLVICIIPGDSRGIQLKKKNPA